MTDIRRKSSNPMMNLPLICIMLLTPKTIINQTTKKANQFSPTTTIASRFKINDNYPLQNEPLNVPNAKTITLFTPPLHEGEHTHEPQITQSEQTAEYICTTDINGPEIKYGTVRSANRKPELNCYHTTVIEETNEHTIYPQGEDTECGVMKEGYATPVLAKNVEPPEGHTTMITAITRACNISNATNGGRGKSKVCSAISKASNQTSRTRPLQT